MILCTRGHSLMLWNRLVQEMAHIVLLDQKDTFRWGLQQNRSFLVKSMYKPLK